MGLGSLPVKFLPLKDMCDALPFPVFSPRELNYFLSMEFRSDAYFHIPYIHLCVARQNAAGEWESQLVKDTGFAFQDSFAGRLFAQYDANYKARPYLHLKDGYFSAVLYNPDCSIFTPPEKVALYNSMAFSNENDYVELEFTFRDPDTGLCEYMVAGIHSKFHTVPSLIKHYSSSEFWSDADALREFEKCLIGRHGPRGFLLHYEKSDGCGGSVLGDDFFPISDVDGAPALFSRLSNIQIVGIGEEEESIFVPS